MGVVLQKRWSIVSPAVLMVGWQLTIGGFALLPLTFLIEGIPSRLTAANVAGRRISGLPWHRRCVHPMVPRHRILGPQLVTFISLLSPVVAVLAGIVVLRQAFDVRQAFGIGLVIAAVMSGAVSSIQVPLVRRLRRSCHWNDMIEHPEARDAPKASIVAPLTSSRDPFRAPSAAR